MDDVALTITRATVLLLAVLLGFALGQYQQRAPVKRAGRRILAAFERWDASLEGPDEAESAEALTELVDAADQMRLALGCDR